MSKLTVSRRSYLLSHPSTNAMRAAGSAAASGAERARQRSVRAHHAQVLRHASVPEKAMTAEHPLYLTPAMYDEVERLGGDMRRYAKTPFIPAA